MRTTLVTVHALFGPSRTQTLETVEPSDLVAAFETAVRLAGIDPESPEVHDAIHDMLGLAGIVSSYSIGGYLLADGARHCLGRALSQCGATTDPVPDAGGAVSWH